MSAVPADPSLTLRLSRVTPVYFSAHLSMKSATGSRSALAAALASATVIRAVGWNTLTMLFSSVALTVGMLSHNPLAAVRIESIDCRVVLEPRQSSADIEDGYGSGDNLVLHLADGAVI